MDSVADILFALRSKGVTLWAEDGRLRYHAVEGTLTSEDIGKIRGRMGEIVAFCQRSCPEQLTNSALLPRTRS
jgi:hypothetical protein